MSMMNMFVDNILPCFCIEFKKENCLFICIVHTIYGHCSSHCLYCNLWYVQYDSYVHNALCLLCIKQLFMKQPKHWMFDVIKCW